jgi:predicted Rossmann-fold nucleotide-binding protein
VTLRTAVGHALAQSGRPLVYGGGKSGLMGLVSGSALVSGGEVVGVRPIAMVRAGASEGVDREELGEGDERVRRAMCIDRSKVRFGRAPGLGKVYNGGT